MPRAASLAGTVTGLSGGYVVRDWKTTAPGWTRCKKGGRWEVAHQKTRDKQGEKKAAQRKAIHCTLRFRTSATDGIQR